ncbi:hypothetical protein Nepgr_011737 [Nepenthes gracilis]|uniref:Uncharacterized protein n=1 Tax=Nepenthes gracilis TaxID=150966 RepID=A0AAD3SG76_NEPGR|nr:hypothetical protein Nepgr_011737 [Nepenthes gracilis]
MGSEALKGSWFSSLWRISRGNILHQENAVIGILAFEVANMMSKIVCLWNSLTDRQLVRLREDVVNSFGIINLVSEDENLLMELACSEIIESLNCVIESVMRLGKRCFDPVYNRLELFFVSLVENTVELHGCEYRWKKMEKKVKKMERFVAATSQLYQEMEVLVELEQTLRRMQSSPETNHVKLLEFQQKVMWQRQEVKNLREMSPWSRTYDYTVQLLARSIFTIIGRLKVVLGVHQAIFVEERNISGPLTASSLCRSRSVVQSSVHPSENHSSIFYSGPLGKSSSKLGFRARKKQQLAQQNVANLHKNNPLLKTKRFVQSGPFKGCMMAGSDSPIVHSCMPSRSGSLSSPGTCLDDICKPRGTTAMPLLISKIFGISGSVLSFQCTLSETLPFTLGKAALSLHYANIILLIEKFASSPHLIGADARDDLYHMLPTSIRSTLRARLKMHPKSLAASAYDAALAAEWSMAMVRILEWLSPLAHNTVRWHSERNFEKQHMIPRASVLLVQTLYFANQAKAEAAITELLMGLNYLCRFGKEFNQTTLSGPAGNVALNDCFIETDTVACHA